MIEYFLSQENLVEAKHHKLARSLRSGGNTRELKPTSTVRDALNTILAYPPTTALTTEEQDLIWKFRFYLSTQKKALTKFVKCVNWKVAGEKRQALEMLNLWAPPDPEDALELLGPAFNHSEVRRYAIARLDQAPDDDLMLYLLQLVQALKYEDFESIKAHELLVKEKDLEKDLEKSDKSEKEAKSSEHSSTVLTTVGVCFLNSFSLMLHVHFIFCNLHFQSTESVIDPTSSCHETPMNLASFLIHRACQNSTLANYFYWYLTIECEEQPDPALSVKQDTRVREMYFTVQKMFCNALAQGNAVWQKRRAFLTRQKTFIDQLVSLVKAVACESGNRKRKIDRLKALLAGPDPVYKINFSSFEPIPFPLDPEIYIKGIIPEKYCLFPN